MFWNKNEKEQKKDYEENLVNKDDGKDDRKEEIQILKGIKTAMPDPYYVRDMDYNIILWPDAIAQLTGYSKEEAKKIKCYDIFKADVCNDCPTQKCVENKEFLKDAMVDVYDKQDNKLTALVSNAGVYDEDGSPIGAVEIVKDNTSYQKLMNSIMEKSESLGSVSEELAASSQEVSAMSDNLNKYSNESLNLTKEGFQNATNVKQKSDNCIDFANEVQDSMEQLNSSMKETMESIVGLKDKSSNIQSIIETIQSISSQTNLLALNASIEAARAGDAGRGFAVVANEIRKLSSNTEKSTEEISNTIEHMVNLIDKSTEHSKASEQNVSLGREKVESLIKLVSDIRETSLKLNDVMKGLEEKMEETNDISTNQNSSMTELANASQEVASIAENLNSEVDKIKHKVM